MARMSNTESAYWLGVRDARLGHAETHPVRPFSREEFRAYRQGYSDQRTANELKLPRNR